MAQQSYQLVMNSGPTPGKSYPLEQEEINIGRDVTNDVVINDAEISRRHARLTMKSGAYMLEDLGSTNGTFVNGQRITGPHLMRPGEMILLGENVILAFQGAAFDPDATVIGVPGPAAAEPTPPPRPAEEVLRDWPPPTPQPPPDEPAYSGRVPPSPIEPEVPEEKPSNRRLYIIGCGCLVVLLCIAGAATLWYIDANFLWCNLLPFLPGCP